ncbi:MAG TPA: twin-arginine translocase TatA/TatE family subunit [Candidatus Deferrimicrobiaceae bacterium]|nr:twin-arginine translocase TatA/TatE family subunit [Candidatus Deferrimicrobiaceae bacterium]
MDLFLVLVAVLIVALVWRGPKTLPEIGRMLGRGVREARTEAAKMSSREETTEDEGRSSG